MRAIKIISIPAGEAPPHIREAWVGLVLPLAEPEMRRIRSAGVLNGPGSYFKYIYKFLTGQYTNYEGYVVEGVTAIAILARHNPTAAEWWRENSPYLLKPGQFIFFEAAYCQEAETVIWPPPPDQSAL